MIVGIGTDIVAIHRIRAALERPRTGARFRDRVFTPDEVAYCERRRTCWESFAARFAAKEAFFKAFGEAAAWQEVAVVRDSGPPRFALSGRTALRAAERGIARVHLSISHDGDFASAFVVADDASG